MPATAAIRGERASPASPDSRSGGNDGVTQAASPGAPVAVGLSHGNDLSHVPGRGMGDDIVDRKTELFEQHIARSRRAKVFHAQEATLPTQVAVPALLHAGFHCHARGHRCRQHAFLIVG